VRKPNRERNLEPNAIPAIQTPALMSSPGLAVRRTASLPLAYDRATTV
jgi:hypothetical protein